MLYGVSFALHHLFDLVPLIAE
jgi:hypothetical protein